MLKRIILTTSLCISLIPSVSQASIDGWLGGLQLGRYNADYTAANQGYTTVGGVALGPAPIKEDQGRLAGRAFLGYSFNQYLATELGYTRFQGTSFENIYGVLNANVDLGIQTFDLIGKVKMPLNDQFNIYAKLGAAYVKKDTDENRVAKTIPFSGGTLILPSNNKILYRATYGLGVTYELNTTFSVEVGWSRVEGQGQVQQTDLGFIGIVYHFDQFLT